MEYKELGNTGLFVSSLCLGTMTFGGKDLWQVIGTSAQEEANEIVEKSLDAGINFFDTANVYSFGESERILGKALGKRRKDVIVASKVRIRVGEGPNQVGLSRVHILDQVERSLKNLGTDYLDLYQIHSWDDVTAIEDTLKTMNDLVRAGKVRYLGISNFAAWQIVKAQGYAKANGLEDFKSLQAYYSLAGRELEREIIPALQDQNMGLLVWSPLAGGFLTGKYTRENDGEEGSRRKLFDYPPVNKENGYNIVETLKDIAWDHDATVPQVALAWLLHQEAVTSVIIGSKNITQLEDNLKSVDITLTKEQLLELDKVSALTPEYPAWFTGSGDRRPGESRWKDLRKEFDGNDK